MLNLMIYSFLLRNMNDDENSAVVCVLMVLSKPATNARNLDKFGICNRGSGAERGRTAIKLYFPKNTCCILKLTRFDPSTFGPRKGMVPLIDELTAIVSSIQGNSSTGV